jgi:hypothetical protein
MWFPFLVGVFATGPVFVYFRKIEDCFDLGTQEEAAVGGAGSGRY